MRTSKLSLLLGLSFALFSCGKTDGVAPSVDAVIGSVVISPTAITLAGGNLTSFTASGGTGPYVYSIVSGGGSILSTTGNFTAPMSAGTTVVRVDAVGSFAEAIVTVNAALQISPSSQSLSINGTQAFTSSGGVAPITFSLASVLGSVNASGLYTAPGSAGTSVVRATDAIGNTSDATVHVFASLGISPSSVTVAVNNTVAFSAGGGSTPYTYSITSGSGTINASTGLFTAAATSGSVTVRVTDNLGNHADAIVTVNDTLDITPASQTLNTGDTLTFSSTGGVPPLTYSIQSGGGSINSATGDYTAPGTIGSAVVEVTDSYGNSDTANVTITSVLTIAPTTKVLAVNNTFTFTGSGGTPPLVYSVTTASGTGTVNSASGLYTAQASAGSANVRVTDALGATANATITINAALAITPSSQTMTINAGLTFSSTGGVVPYTYSMVSGGGSVNASSGAYTAPGSIGTDVVRVTDAFGNTANATITINNLVGISPAAVTLAVNNTTTFVAVNGTGPFTFSKVSGGGNIVSGTGFFTGPATSGTTIVRVTDSLSNTSDATVTINPALAISPSSKTLAVNNLFTFSASGGVSPYAYSVVSGTGTINSSSGAYTAPASSGSATVRVTDGYGNISNSAVTINNALAISPASATITVVDTKTFTSSGGISPYSYSVATGDGSVGAASGIYTPGTAGVKTIRSTDSFGNTSDSTLTVNTALAITPSTANVTVDSDFEFDYTGGVDPVTFSIVGGGAGSIDSVTGVYTAGSSAGSVTVRATDALGHTSNAAVTIYLPLSISPTSVTKGINATQTFTATGGLGALTFAMSSGLGTINSASGLYTAPSSASSDVVQVSDTIGNVVTATVNVVNTLTITPATLKLPVFSTATFSAVLGTPAYSYSVISGSGSISTVSGTGVYTAPSTAGSGGVRVTDSGAITSDAVITHIEPVSLSSGAYHTCVRYSDNSVKCWGDAVNGNLGSGSTSDLGDAANEGGGYLPFVNLGTGRTATAIASGFNHNCAILDNNTVKCWGYNLYGQLGQGNTASLGDGPNEMGDSLPTVNLGTGRTASSIYAFGNVSCAILDNGSTKCWGRNTYGQLGQGDVNSRGDSANEMGDNLQPINFGTGRTALSLTGGTDFVCALLDNSTVKCFGRNNYGQLGQGSTTSLGDGAGEMGDSLPAINLGTGLTATKISAFYTHVCAILSNSTVKCWGRNQSGQLGQGSTSALGDAAGEMGDSLLAINLGTGIVPSSVVAARQATCVTTSTGAVKCFGLNSSGQLLIGNTTQIGDSGAEMGNALASASFGTGFNISKISMNYYGGCIITDTKQIKCWGSSLNGALLNGSAATNLGDAAGELGNSLPFVNH